VLGAESLQHPSEFWEVAVGEEERKPTEISGIIRPR
jgi:hypothetical protein